MLDTVAIIATAPKDSTVSASSPAVNNLPAQASSSPPVLPSDGLTQSFATSNLSLGVETSNMNTTLDGTGPPMGGGCPGSGPPMGGGSQGSGPLLGVHHDSQPEKSHPISRPKQASPPPPWPSGANPGFRTV